MRGRFKRWLFLLRGKAGEYEHADRLKNISVSSPSLDDICNEMEAFLDGYESVAGVDKK